MIKKVLDVGKHWIWYPGDFEIHEGMLQNFSREERGMSWPAYWNVDDCYRNVKFERVYDLEESTSFKVITHQKGYITIDGEKFRVNEDISLTSGKHEIIIFIFSTHQLPTIYIEGEIIFSDENWEVSNYINKKQVGYNQLFTQINDNPNDIPYERTKSTPRTIVVKNDGLLIDFGEELNAELNIYNLKQEITVCYGESESEALDVSNCYYKQSNVSNQTLLPKRAFRFLFIPGYTDTNVDVVATSVFLPMENLSKFKSNNKLINNIWNVSTRTFKLCSDLFYIDGIKRDRWIWGGDAYQDNFINQYSFFDEDIDKRTILALRGHDQIQQHINTIVDYSLLWIVSIYNHYEMTADKEFIQLIMPRMKSMMDYLLAQTNELGFIYGRDDDWIFVDWSEMDKEGTIAAEQMFLLQSLKTIITCEKILDEDTEDYIEKYNQLKKNILNYFWNEQKGAFIDSYESGKNSITRHANILAILFDVVDDVKKRQILTNVLLNDSVTQITTPYFKFFEQDALCKMGQLSLVYRTIKEYWGSMLKKGATTIWEEYDPKLRDDQQYAMYGDPFGKSLCHAWGASPIYLLGRYFFGLRPTKPGYETFEINPHLDMFEKLECTLPIKNGVVKFILDDRRLTIWTNKDGGTVIINGKRVNLKRNEELVI